MRTIKFRGRDFAGMWHKGDLIHNDDDLLIRQGCLSTFIENEAAAIAGIEYAIDNLI